MSQNLIKFGLLCYKCNYSTYADIFYNYRSSHNLSAEYKKYRTTPKDLLSELSRMYTNNIRGYTVSPLLQKHLLDLVDYIDPESKKVKLIDTILNDGGVLKGYYLEKTAAVEKLLFKEINLWLK